MDTRTWAPQPKVVAVGWVFAAAAAAWALVSGDRQGQLLLGLAAVTLAVLSLHGSVVRPRLAPNAEGITVRRLTGTDSWPWARVRARVTRTRRFGREVSVLEIDTSGEDERLIVLGRLDLGADPEDVASELVALRTG